MRLAIIIPRFNPCGYVRPRQNYEHFIAALRQQVPMDCVFVVEALFGSDQPSQWAWLSFPAGEAQFANQKEALVNIGIQRVPDKFNAVAWVDADLLFQNPHWYEETLHTLKDVAVVQMFDTVLYIGAHGGFKKRGLAIAANPQAGGWRTPGGAIAAHRQLVSNGIYDDDVTGGGDDIFMAACSGDPWRKRNAEWEPHIREWCTAFGRQDVGCISGTVHHLYHGQLKNRGYQERYTITDAHRYNPATDVGKNPYGLLTWTGNKPELQAAIRGHFLSRDEDN